MIQYRYRYSPHAYREDWKPLPEDWTGNVEHILLGKRQDANLYMEFRTAPAVPAEIVYRLTPPALDVVESTATETLWWAREHYYDQPFTKMQFLTDFCMSREEWPADPMTLARVRFSNLLEEGWLERV